MKVVYELKWNRDMRVGDLVKHKDHDWIGIVTDLSYREGGTAKHPTGQWLSEKGESDKDGRVNRFRLEVINE